MQQGFQKQGQTENVIWKRALESICFQQADNQRIKWHIQPRSQNYPRSPWCVRSSPKDPQPKRDPLGSGWYILGRTQRRNLLVFSGGQRSKEERKPLVEVHRDRNNQCVSWVPIRIGETRIQDPLGHRGWIQWPTTRLLGHSLPDVPGAYGTDCDPGHDTQTGAWSGNSPACSGQESVCDGLHYL